MAHKKRYGARVLVDKNAQNMAPKKLNMVHSCNLRPHALNWEA